MTDAGASRTTRALAVRGPRQLSDSGLKRRSVRSAPSKQWQPPEGLAPEDVLAVIDAAPSERDRLLLRVLWATRYGGTGEPAPVHPHLFRHARVRQIMRTTKSLPIAQQQAGWSRLQMAYLSVTDDEVRLAMQAVEL